MSLTIQQILLDSERLATRLKEDDSAADALLSQTQTVYKQIDAMKQYAEETGELNELARQRPHSVLVAGIQQESRHLRELQQENRELKAALEEHQNALELIMSKYRQQITHLVQVSKLNLTNLYNNQYCQVIERQADKMDEMAAVMKMAAEIDEKGATQYKEMLSRLSTENKGLRELLDISVKFGSTHVKVEEIKGTDNDLVNVKKEKDDEKTEDIKDAEDSDSDETSPSWKGKWLSGNTVRRRNPATCVEQCIDSSSPTPNSSNSSVGNYVVIMNNHLHDHPLAKHWVKSGSGGDGSTSAPENNSNINNEGQS